MGVNVMTDLVYAVEQILAGLWAAAVEDRKTDLQHYAETIVAIVQQEDAPKGAMPVRIYVDGSLTRTCVFPEGGRPTTFDYFDSPRAARAVGRTTNQMEYRAILDGLLYAEERDMEDIEILSDSELAINQINGECAIESKKLKPLLDAVRSLATAFAHVKFTHVYREENPAGKVLG